MGWEEAYEHKIALWKFWNSISGRTYGTYFGESMARKNPAIAEQPDHPYFSRIASIEATKMMLADPIWISPDMMDIWEAAVTVPEEKAFQPEPLLHEDLLVHQGFIYLPRPMYTLDGNGLKMAYRAIAWSVTGMPDDDGRYSGIALSIYAHKNDDDDYAGATQMADDLIRGTELQLAHVTPWPFGESFERLRPSFEDSQKMGYDQDSMEKAWSGLWIEIQALFRLMNQRISTVTDEQAPRPTRRRAKAAGIDDTPVKLVVLRRAKGKPSGDTREVDWQNRWIVDGHWRDQWYATLNAHRQVWISSYVKGPEDKELKVKPIKAYKLVR